jgi:hypothetical protein
VTKWRPGMRTRDALYAGHPGPWPDMSVVVAMLVATNHPVVRATEWHRRGLVDGADR